MFLYACGDSNTWGCELADTSLVENADDEYRLAYSWPGVISKKLDVIDDFMNDGKSGGSNDRITRRTTNFVSKWINNGKSPNDLMVIICWSNEERREWYGPEGEGMYEGYYDMLINRAPTNNPSPHILNFQKYYTICFSHEHEAYTRKINHILLVQTLLEQYKIPYIFFEAGWILSRTIAEKHKFVSTYDLINSRRFFNFGTNSFMRLCYEHKIKAKSKHHPSEEGHELLSTLLTEYILKHELWKFD